MNQSEIAPKAGRVLVVDDHPSVRQLLSLALQLVGFDIVEAATPAEAWACLNRRPPDALLIDLQPADPVGRHRRGLVHLETAQFARATATRRRPGA